MGQILTHIKNTFLCCVEPLTDEGREETGVNERYPREKMPLLFSGTKAIESVLFVESCLLLPCPGCLDNLLVKSPASGVEGTGFKSRPSDTMA